MKDDQLHEHDHIAHPNAGRTVEERTRHELVCPSCGYEGRLRAQTDELAGVTAAWCPECGCIGEPDDFERADP